LRRKYTCKVIINNIGVGEIYEKYFGNNEKIILPNSLAELPNSLAELPNSLAELPNSLAKLDKVSKEFKCKYCEKYFKHRSSKSTHEKSRCKKKRDNDNYNDLKKLVDLLNEQRKQDKKELKKKDKQIEELIKKTGVNIGTQNNINNNIQNNIKILAYGKTDMSHLNDNDYLGFLNHNNFCVPYMIKKLHFDPKKPENHNIYISNMKNSYITMWDGKKWNIKDRSEIIDDILEDNTNILEDKIEDWANKGRKYPLIMKKFNRYIERRENDAILNKIKQEIKFILFNNRKMVKSDV